MAKTPIITHDPHTGSNNTKEVSGTDLPSNKRGLDVVTYCPEYTFTYDANDRVATRTDGTNTWNASYDANDNFTGWVLQ